MYRNTQPKALESTQDGLREASQRLEAQTKGRQEAEDAVSVGDEKLRTLSEEGLKGMRDEMARRVELLDNELKEREVQRKAMELRRRRGSTQSDDLARVRAEMEAQRAKEQHELKNALAEREAMIAALQKELERQKAPPEA